MGERGTTRLAIVAQLKLYKECTAPASKLCLESCLKVGGVNSGVIVPEPVAALEVLVRNARF